MNIHKKHVDSDILKTNNGIKCSRILLHRTINRKACSWYAKGATTKLITSATNLQENASITAQLCPSPTHSKKWRRKKRKRRCKHPLETQGSPTRYRWEEPDPPKLYTQNWRRYLIRCGALTNPLSRQKDGQQGEEREGGRRRGKRS